MARYQRAAQARDLIQRVARLNNQAFTSLTALKAMLDTLAALAATPKLEVQAAITDMGYDPTEIQIMLTNWGTVFATMDGLGMTKVDAPQ